MKIAVIATFRHPTRLNIKERSVMQPAAPELIAALCPENAEIEVYNEKEVDVPLDRHWDLVFFSYLHPFFEHTKVLSTLFRRAGMTTVAGGRHASLFPEEASPHFDAVVTGEPEGAVPQLIEDFRRGRLQRLYRSPSTDPSRIPSYRYELVDYAANRYHTPSLEASRGCPFSCSFCILTGNEKYRYRPVADVIRDIETRMRWNRHFGGLLDRTFQFYDNNLGGSPKYLRRLCEALIPLRVRWGCALTMNVLEDRELVQLMSRAGCRFVYTGLESLNPDSLQWMNKRQNHLKNLREIIRHTYASGILLSCGLIVGTDGDTHEYLERVPDYLSDLRLYAITFLGIACPYPGTPFFEQVAREGRLLPGVTSRDLDCYTVCHRPLKMHPSEAVDHLRRLTGIISGWRRAASHCGTKLMLSRAPRYKFGILLSCPEIVNSGHNLSNPKRTYIAGQDPIEEWDARMMDQLGLTPTLVAPQQAPARVSA